MTPPPRDSDIAPLDLDARWADYGQRTYGKSGRRIGRELQGLVRDTLHDELFRTNARAEAALADVRAARRGAAAPAPGPADPSHADLEPQNGAASPVENEA